MVPEFAMLPALAVRAPFEVTFMPAPIFNVPPVTFMVTNLNGATWNV